MSLKAELLDFSRFDLNAILRGLQLTFVGAYRALQNPGLWTTQHYRQAALAVACGLAIRVLIEIPIAAVRLALWCVSWFVRLDAVTWDDTVYDGLRFLQETVLQLPLLLMALLRHATPALDDLFMLSLQWVDRTYAQKHPDADPRQRYCDNLQAYGQRRVRRGTASSSSSSSSSSAAPSSWLKTLTRFGRKAAFSAAVVALSYVPLVGRLALPAASFFAFRRAVGLGPAALVFGLALVLPLPRRALVVFLQTYYGARSLLRELLAPYFARVRFTPAQQRAWFASREGLLFGFGAGYYLLLRHLPLVGVLVYGIAEAATAYLVTKVTDPPPPPPPPPPSSDPMLLHRRHDHNDGDAAFAESQQTWHNKKAFLALALDNLDALPRRPAAQPTASTAATTATAAAAGPAGTAASGPQHRRQPPGHSDDDPPPPYSAASP